MKECYQKVCCNFDQFGITIPDSAKYILRVGAHVSLRFVTKASHRGGKNLNF